VKRRQLAEQRGRWAEFAAAAALILKGYRVLGHRLRTPYGEVDFSGLEGRGFGDR
jgi:putative endonuclease